MTTQTEAQRLEAEVQALRGAVPAGWRLAPLNPTPEMKKVGGIACGFGQDIAHHTYVAMLAAAPQPAAQPLQNAMQIVIQAMQEDPGYAWSWHCNIAMAFVDAGGNAYIANQGAARFMRSLAAVEPAHELPAQGEKQ